MLKCTYLSFLMGLVGFFWTKLYGLITMHATNLTSVYVWPVGWLVGHGTILRRVLSKYLNLSHEKRQISISRLILISKF